MGWRPWFGPAGFAISLLVVGLVSATLIAIVGIDQEHPPPRYLLAATLIQDATFLAVAYSLARTASKPRLWHFGLRELRSGRAWLTAAFIGAGYYAIAGVYATALPNPPKQNIVNDLAANDSASMALLATGLIVVLAPIAEEIFFRGFFYGSLRARLRPVAAIAINAAVFGSIHYSGPETLTAIPPLALLGAAFCLIYERTGSLYPVIALHAFNNMIALAAQLDEHRQLPLIAGVVVITGTVLIAQRRSAESTPNPLAAPPPA